MAPGPPSPPAEPSSAAALNALMAAYQDGELAAFEQLYRHLQPSLRNYLLSLTRNATRAEDLLQETFLQLHRSRHTFRPPRPVKPWAYGIARHVYLMDCRAWRRCRRRETNREQELPIPAAGDSLSDRDLVHRAMTRLSAARREPLLLHHVWGFSFKEIAGRLGIREGAAKVRSHRAMAQLRALLQDDSELGPTRADSPGS